MTQRIILNKRINAISSILFPFSVAAKIVIVFQSVLLLAVIAFIAHSAFPRVPFAAVTAADDMHAVYCGADVLLNAYAKGHSQRLHSQDGGVSVGTLYREDGGRTYAGNL